MNLLPVTSIHGCYVRANSANRRLSGSSKISSQLFLVPFARDMFFVNRVDILDNINKYIKQYSRVALSGIGGVGSVSTASLV